MRTSGLTNRIENCMIIGWWGAMGDDSKTTESGVEKCRMAMEAMIIRSIIYFDYCESIASHCGELLQDSTYPILPASCLHHHKFMNNAINNLWQYPIHSSIVFYILQVRFQSRQKYQVIGTNSCWRLIAVLLNVNPFSLFWVSKFYLCKNYCWLSRSLCIYISSSQTQNDDFARSPCDVFSAILGAVHTFLHSNHCNHKGN